MKHIMIGGMVESSAAALGCMRICRVPLEEARKVVHQALDPVSYTHLDVYKRQVQRTQGRLLHLRQRTCTG